MTTYANISLSVGFWPAACRIFRPAQESMAKNPIFSTMASVYRLMLTSGYFIKDNSNALLCVCDVCAVGSLAGCRFGCLSACSNLALTCLSTPLTLDHPLHLINVRSRNLSVVIFLLRPRYDSIFIPLGI